MFLKSRALQPFAVDSLFSPLTEKLPMSGTDIAVKFSCRPVCDCSVHRSHYQAADVSNVVGIQARSTEFHARRTAES